MHKKIKLISWYVLVALLSWAMFGVGTSLSFNSVTGIGISLPISLFFLLLTGLTIIGYAVFRSRTVPLISSLIMSLGFLAWYGFTGLNLLGTGLFILLNFEAYRRVGRQTQRIKVNMWEIFNHGLYPIVIGIFILTSFAVYQSPLAEELENSERLPSRTQVFFEEVADTFIGPRIDTNNEQERQYIVGQVAAETFREFNALLMPYFQYAPPLLAFALFVILWGLSWIFVWVSAIVGIFIFWILKKTGVVRIEEREIKSEVILA